MKTRPSKFRVLLVEDRNLFRESIAELLNFQPDIAVVGAVSTVSEAREQLERQPIDVVLLDYDLGNESSFALLSYLAHLTPRPSVLVLCGEISSSFGCRLIANGVKSILWKGLGFRDLIRAIRQSEFEPLTPVPGEVKAPPVQLTRTAFTKRQMDVACAVMMGCATKEIAGELGVSDGAVKSTLQQLFAKTGTRSRPQLVRAMLEQNLFSPAGDPRLAKSALSAQGTGAA